MDRDEYTLHIRYPLENLIPFHAGYYEVGDVLTVSIGDRVIRKARVEYIGGDMVEFSNIELDVPKDEADAA
jgi:hypothetical protein